MFYSNSLYSTILVYPGEQRQTRCAHRTWVPAHSHRARGGGGAGGLQPPPTFLEILKSYWEKVFSAPPPPTFSH